MSVIREQPITLWTMRSPDGRVIRCEVRQIRMDLELHVAYGDELVWSQRFHGPTAQAEIEMRTAAWRTALVQKGFMLNAEWTAESPARLPHGR
jgi:hypothetical protein